MSTHSSEEGPEPSLGGHSEPPAPQEERDRQSEPAESVTESGERIGDDRTESPSAGTRPHQKRRKQQRPFWKELPILVGVALVLAFLIQYFLARVYMIPSGSMEETLHGCPGCTGDRILVDKMTYNFSDPSPGDVVVFRGPEAWLENDSSTDQSENPVAQFFQSIGSAVGLAPPDERDFVKRIVATGGQTVQCCDENRVVVDGEPLEEPYLHWQGEPEQEPFEEVTVPEDSVWVMGDNRNNSADSRYQGGGGEQGAVPLDNIIGKARFIVLPPSRWGGVSDDDPQDSDTIAAPDTSVPSPQRPQETSALAVWPALVLGSRVTSVLRRRSDEYGDDDECRDAASTPGAPSW